MKFLILLEALKSNRDFSTLERIKDVQPFVFLPTKEDLIRLGTFEASTIEPTLDLDLPFKVCSFETVGMSQEMPQLEGKPKGPAIDVASIIAEETETPFHVFHFLGVLNGTTKIAYTLDPRKITEDSEINMWCGIRVLVQEFLKDLKNGQYGTTSPRTVFKWKENGEKKQTRINKIIHVRPRSNSCGASSDEHSQVNWSHAFWVMGHWREISGIGKDREGNYSMVDKTWVIPHVKNAELGDPVLKIRLKSNSSSSQSEAV